MIIYKVQEGDTILKVALKFQVDISEILEANPQFNPLQMNLGQELIIPDPYTLNCFEQRVIILTNQFRVTNGLCALSANWQLSRVARFKSEDMRNRDYAGHTSPIYGSAFDMMKAFGISFNTAAENVAGGQATPEEVVCEWINQPSHRINLLNTQYCEIGVGYVQGGSYKHYWTQMFIG